jgi:hypothetical protein
LIYAIVENEKRINIMAFTTVHFPSAETYRLTY